jgi:hypothetical protein
MSEHVYSLLCSLTYKHAHVRLVLTHKPLTYVAGIRAYAPELASKTESLVRKYLAVPNTLVIAVVRATDTRITNDRGYALVQVCCAGHVIPSSKSSAWLTRKCIAKALTDLTTACFLLLIIYTQYSTAVSTVYSRYR